MHADLPADALSALLYTYSNSILVIADAALTAAIASRKLSLQSRYLVSVSFKRSRTTIRHASEGTCRAILGEVLSLGDISPELFVQSANHESELPGDPPPRRCFLPPVAPPVPAPPPAPPLPPPVTLSKPSVEARPPLPSVPFRVDIVPPPFFREPSNALLR
jgi:hypothetical protein